MNRNRFDALIEAYGADPARWPAERRGEAQAFAAAPEAAASLHAERTLDRLLDAYQAEAPSQALRQRILARAPSRRAVRGWRPTGAFWISGAGLAAACAAGVIVGVSLGGALSAGAAPSDRDAEAAAGFDGASALGSPIDAGRAG